MFTQGFKWHFIRVLSGLLAALCLLSTASHGQDEGDDAPPPTPSTIQTDTNSPPVAQTLVPEGIFAMQLAEALKLGPVPDEATAEELLSNLGIEPKNGWLAEYPVTPAVLGDVEKGISVASDQGKIALTKDQALKLVSDVKAKLGFDVNPGSNAPAGLIERPGNKTIYSYTDSEGVLHITDDYDSIPKEYQKNAKIVTESTLHQPLGGTDGSATEAPGPQYMANPNPEDINNYYYEQGPPLVTYYAPPDPYYYLYSWVPYPFWSTGFYFPGFFVLNNFHRQVFFNRQPYFVAHHVGGSAFSRPLSVGPVNRAWPGHMTPNAMAHPRWFSTPNAQASARAIVTLNQNRSRSINGTGAAISQMNTSKPPFSSAGNFRTLGNAPAVLNNRTTMHNDSFRSAPHFGGRIFNQPAFNQRTYAPVTPRFYSPPAFTQGPAFRAPRSFGGSVAGGFHSGGAVGGFHGGGNFTNQGRGGSFAGASRGGHR
jgi:hypothetical protein